MATTAVITRPTVTVGTEPFIVNLTRHVFSGMTSYVGANTAANMSRHISRWEWAFGDGGTASGGVVQHRFTQTGTYNVTLTAFGDDGTSASTTYSVTIAGAPAFAFTKYLRSGGADNNTAPRDGNTNDDAHAYKSIEWTNLQWRGGNPHASFGQMVLNKGDTTVFTGLNDFVGGAADPDYGPLKYGAIGAGANPLVTPTSGAQVAIASDGTHDTANSTLWSNPIVLDGIDVTWPVPQSEGLAGDLATLHPSTSIENATITKSRISCISFTAVAAQFVVFNSTVTLGQWRGGIAISGGSKFCVVDSCLVKQSGNDAGLAHQTYFTSCEDSSILDSTMDQNGATAFSGHKRSNSHRMYTGRILIKNCATGFDIGGNAGEQEIDIVDDAPVLDSCINVGMYSNYLLRYGSRNARVYGGCSQEVFREQSLSATQFVDTVDIYNLSANLITGQFINFTSNDTITFHVSWFTNFTVKNNAVVKANAGTFYTLQYAVDVAKVSIDYNVYWRVGGTPDADANFAVVEGVTKTWAQWKALGLDTHSVFRDPLFTAAKDLTPQAGSPCINAGTPIGVITKDVNGVVRSATTPTIGAIEVSSGGGGGGGQVVVPSGGDTLQSMKPLGREVYIGPQVRRHLRPW